MRRFHLFEIHDQAWCPKAIRDGLTDYLAQSEKDRQVYNPILPLILEAAGRLGISEAIDLCSGGGGPWIHWMGTNLARANSEGMNVSAEGGGSLIRSVILTDKFPNQLASSKAMPAGVSYSGKSVDATAVPSDLRGVRTLFTSFHHFQPETAQAILRDAVAQRQPIGIFEFTHRGMPALFIMLLSIFSVWITTPRMRPLTWSRLILTYPLPVIPFAVMFDGIVSCLRTYTPSELLALANEAGAGDFTWKAGLIREGTTPGLPITYLIGVPRRESASATPSE